MKYNEINTTPVLLNIGYAKHDGDWNFKNIDSPFTRLHYIKSGTAAIVRGSERIELKAGHLYVTPAHTPHSYENAGPFETYYLHIFFDSHGRGSLFELMDIPAEFSCPDWIEDVFVRLKELHPDKALADYDPGRYDNPEAFANKLSASSDSDLPVAMETEGLLRLLLARLLQDAGTKVRDIDPRVGLCIDYINSRLDQEIRIDKLAELAALSKDHFIRLFAAETGLTPLRYINKKKIEEAQLRLLLERSKSVKDIAFELGFENTQYFNRLFHKLCGVSPGRYRQTNI